jgi:hypothetical protein
MYPRPIPEHFVHTIWRYRVLRRAYCVNLLCSELRIFLWVFLYALELVNYSDESIYNLVKLRCLEGNTRCF